MPFALNRSINDSNDEAITSEAGSMVRLRACGNPFTGQLKFGRFSIQTYGFFYGSVIRSAMSTVQFEWDDKKDAENQAKHHVSFQDALAAS